MIPAFAFVASIRSRTSRLACDRLEGGDLLGDELRLAFLVVDAAFDDHDPVGGAELGGRRVGGGEDHAVDATGDVVEPQEHHLLAPLGEELPHLADDPADDDVLAVAAPLELGDRGVGLGPQLGAKRRERVLGDVQPEGLLLEPQQVGLLELLGGDRRVMLRPATSHFGLAEMAVEDRALAREPVGVLLLPVGERLLQHLEHPHPRAPAARRISRAIRGPAC